MRRRVRAGGRRPGDEHQLPHRHFGVPRPHRDHRHRDGRVQAEKERIRVSLSQQVTRL